MPAAVSDLQFAQSRNCRPLSSVPPLRPNLPLPVPPCSARAPPPIPCLLLPCRGLLPSFHGARHRRAPLGGAFSPRTTVGKDEAGVSHYFGLLLACKT
ncbi:unnamed protein product [Urochloa humidicola]